MNNSLAKLGATHTTKVRKHLYKIAKQSLIQKFNPLDTGVMFWDEYLCKWSPSVVAKKELIKL